jgi:hypothetical protein
MLSFGDKTWTDEIAEVTGDSEYQNVAVTLNQPGVVSGYDIDTNTPTYSQAPVVVYSGQARLKPIRWGVNRENSETSNPTTLKSVLVQFPKGAEFVEYPRRGFTLTVDLPVENPLLSNRLFTLTSTLQGSAKATTAFEFMYDEDVVVSG